MILKIFLSIVLLLSSSVAIFTMLEIFGKTERKINIESLKKIHRINGRIFLAFFLLGVITCIFSLSKSKIEFNPRISIHVLSAVAILLLFPLKIAFVKYYKQFYSQAKLIGVIISLLTFNLVIFSLGYVLIVGDLKNIKTELSNFPTKSEKDNSEKFKMLFNNLCSSCDCTDKKENRRKASISEEIFKKIVLSASESFTTDKNVVNQIRNLYI